MKVTAKTVTPYYTLIQGLYWGVYCLMFSFASAFLLDKNFSNSSIGLVLGFSYAFSALLQPVIASFIKKKQASVSAFLSCIIVVVAVLAGAMLFLPLKGAALGVTMMLMCTLHSSMQPSINSLHRGYELQGLQVNFGFARGMGSISFGIITFLMGQILKRFSPSLIPAVYFAGLILLLICMSGFRSPVFSVEDSASEAKNESLLRRNPHFGVFLIGLVLLAMAHIFLDHFMLQIMMTLGGGSAELGIAIAIAAVIELPAMMLYARMAKKAGPGRILCMAGWVWVIKNMLIMLAKTPATIYAAMLLQFLSYAVYVPATVDYIAKNLPRGDFLKAQALSGSAFTMGSLLATLIGGPAIDLLGIRTSVVLVQLFSLSGAILFTCSVLPRKKARD